MNKGIFTSTTPEWCTPQSLFDALNTEFGFTLDPCSTANNAKCNKFYTILEDGLSRDWTKDRVFMNPPYGREIGKWIKKAYETARGGGLVVCLIPSRTDTAWWHDYCEKGEVRFVRGRIYFTSQKGTGPAPFPSAIVIFRP